MTPPSLEVDVAIIGGGPAGAATALALRRSCDLSVALIDRSESRLPKIGETIQPGCRPLLERLGAWEAFQGDGHLPAYGSCSAWGGGELAHVDFMFRPHGPAWHLNRRKFDERLLKLAADEGVTVFRPATVPADSVEFKGEAPCGAWRLKIRCQGESSDLQARFVVDASGRSASFARRQGARKVIYDHLLGSYRFFTLDAQEPLQDSFTLVEAVEEGWWYSAVLPEDRMVAMFMTDVDQMRAGSLHQARPWLARAQASEHTRRRLVGARPFAEPAVVSASSHLLEPLGGRGWLAVGDAASGFDPLSAQGILYALEGGLRAAAAIRSNLQGRDDRVEAYQRWVLEEFESYLEIREKYYGMEARWPHSPFWQRRRGTPHTGKSNGRPRSLPSPSPRTRRRGSVPVSLFSTERADMLS